MKNNRLTLRIEEKDKARLQELAKQNRTTLSAYIMAKIVNDLKN